MAKLAEQVVDYLTQRKDDMADLLGRLVKAESPSTDPKAQGPVFALLAAAFEQRGYAVRRVRGDRTGGVLMARPQQRTRGLPYQLLLGHGDTVWPVGTLGSMPLQQQGNELRGPGVFDMKGGLVQGIFALDALAATDAEILVTPVFLINSDEEIGSVESTRYVRLLGAHADRVFVLEPSMGYSGKLKTARKGVGRFTVTVQGVAAHAGLDPGQGASAILELSEVIQQLFALNDLERGITVNVGTIDGGMRPNVVAPQARAVVDVRVLTQEDAESVERAIRSIAPTTPGTSLEIEGRVARPPLEKTDRNRELFGLAQRAAADLGVELGEATAGGGSDGNTTSLLAPTLDGLGAVGDGAHAVNEFVFVDKMVERAALLALLLSFPPLAARDTTHGEVIR